MLKHRCKLLWAGLICSVFVVSVFASPALGLEGKAGEVIRTVEDLKELQAKDLLTNGQVIVYIESVRDFGVSYYIVEKTDRRLGVSTSKTYAKVTEMHKGKASIGSENEISNYAGAGLPFPDLKPDDPQAGIKAAWNLDYRHFGDDYRQNNWQYFLTDDRGNIREMSGDWYQLLFNRRTDISPTPSLNPAKYTEEWFKRIIYFKKPFTNKGLSQLQIKYLDAMRDSDVYVFVPGLRRIVRASAGNRCDSLGGIVTTPDDDNSWSGETPMFNWKVLEVKEHLVSGLQPWENYKTGKVYIRKNHSLINTLERRKVWVLEQTPKDTDYCYGKRLFYLDPESWWVVYAELYDRGGSLWKHLDHHYNIFPNPENAGGGGVVEVVGTTAVDLKIWEAGPVYMTETLNNTGLLPSLYTLDALRKRGR